MVIEACMKLCHYLHSLVQVSLVIKCVTCIEELLCSNLGEETNTRLV